jgi:hypothetical protein
MSMDFSSGAGAPTPFDLIPKGQLAFAILTVRGVKASAAGGQYLDCELVIDEGQPFAKRVLWDMIGDPNFAGNSEKYRQMGNVAITRILEAGRGAGPNNPAGYQINAYTELTGLRVPIKIGIEEGTGGHNDKNRVAEYLTPNPASQSGHKGLQQLLAGQFNTAAPAATAPPASGFGVAPATAPATAGFGTAPATAPAPAGFGGQPPSANGGDAVPGFGAAPVAPGPAPSAEPATAPSSAPVATTTSPSNPGATPEWLSQAAPVG